MASQKKITKPMESWCRILAKGLQELGLPDTAARVVADALTEAEAWGRPTHGFMRLRGIQKAIESGLTKGTPDISKEGASFASINGRGCLGYVASKVAVSMAVKKARDTGLAVVGVHHSSHNGMLGYYTWKLAEAGLIGLATTHCLPSVAAFGSNEAVHGTNPIALACPGSKANADPILIDLGTSAITFGELNWLRINGQPLPEGVALDPEGRPTTDGEIARAGHLLPFGGLAGEGKGSALGLLVELLSSVVVGAPPMPTSPQDYGHFFLALRTDLLTAPDTYQTGFDAIVERITGLKGRDGMEPRLPGKRALEQRRKALANGLSIDEQRWNEIQAVLVRKESEGEEALP